MLDIGVVMPSHPTRDKNGYTQRAIHSVWKQELPAQSLSVFSDVNRRGAPYARQQALLMNNQPWTAFLDSDDAFMAKHLRVLAEAQSATGADYVYSWFHLVQFGRVLDHDPVFPVTHFTDAWDNDKPRQTTMTVLVRTELAREIGFWAPEDETTFSDGHRVGEDYVFTLGCMNAGAKIYHVVERTWYWHHHGLNTSGRPDQGDAK
jgi:hypothetical protein